MKTQKNAAYWHAAEFAAEFAAGGDMLMVFPGGIETACKPASIRVVRVVMKFHVIGYSSHPQYLAKTRGTSARRN
jgi:hypothetical protein